MTTKNINYGKPIELYCTTCKKNCIHTVKDYKIVVEHSFEKGYNTIRLDLNYACLNCKHVVPRYDTYRFREEDETVESFERTLIDNMKHQYT